MTFGTARAAFGGRRGRRRRRGSSWLGGRGGRGRRHRSLRALEHDCRPTGHRERVHAVAIEHARHSIRGNHVGVDALCRRARRIHALLLQLSDGRVAGLAHQLSRQGHDSRSRRDVHVDHRARLGRRAGLG